MLPIRIRQHGSEAWAPLEIQGVTPFRKGHIVARFQLALGGQLFVRDGWLMRTNDDSYFAKLADYPHPDGPKGFMKYLFLRKPLNEYLVYDIAREHNAAIEAGELDPDLILFPDLDLDDCLRSAEQRLPSGAPALSVRVHQLYENPRRGAVGRVDFELAGLLSVIQCPLVLQAGSFLVESPSHPDTTNFQPVELERPLQHELADAASYLIAKMSSVPDYLHTAKRNALQHFAYGV